MSVKREVKHEAAVALYITGRNYKEIALALEVTRQTVSIWIRDAMKSGEIARSFYKIKGEMVETYKNTDDAELAERADRATGYRANLDIHGEYPDSQ